MRERDHWGGPDADGRMFSKWERLWGLDVVDLG